MTPKHTAHVNFVPKNNHTISCVLNCECNVAYCSQVANTLGQGTCLLHAPVIEFHRLPIALLEECSCRMAI